MACPTTVNLEDAIIESDELLPVQIFFGGIQAKTEFERIVTFFWTVEADSAKELAEARATSFSENPVIGGKTYEGIFSNSAVRVTYENNGTAKITQSMTSTVNTTITFG